MNQTDDNVPNNDNNNDLINQSFGNLVDISNLSKINEVNSDVKSES